MNTKVINQESASFTYIKNENLRAELISIKENPREIILATGEKINSHFFYSKSAKFAWGVSYFCWCKYYCSWRREGLLAASHRRYSLSTISHDLDPPFYICMQLRNNLQKRCSTNKKTETRLIIPFFVRIIPTLMFYVETRQKICSELTAVPIILKILSKSKRSTSQWVVWSTDLFF